MVRKGILTVLLILTLLVASASLASAAITIEEDEVILHIDYGNFNDEDQKTVQQNAVFNLKSTEAADTEVKITASGLPSGYSAAEKTVTVSANSTQQVSFPVNATHSKDAGNSSIGNIVVKTVAGQELTTKSLVQSTKSMLELVEIEVDYVDEDGDNADDSFNGDEPTSDLGEKVKPGTDMDIKLQFRNLFDKDYDEDNSIIENVEVKLDADDDDLFESGYEDTYDVSDIDAAKKEDLTISFTIDEDAEAKDYTIELTIEAEDGEGSKYEMVREITIDLERERDDVRVSKASISPTTIQNCKAETVTFNFEMKNFGTGKQKDAAFAVYNKALGLNKNVQDIELDEHDDSDDSHSETFQFTVKAGTAPGTYSLNSKTFIDRDELMHTELTNLEVTKCSTGSPAQNTTPKQNTSKPAETVKKAVAAVTTQAGDSTAADPNVTANTSEGAESAPVVKTVEDPYTSQDVLIATLIIGIVLVLTIIILFVVILLRK